MSGLAFEPIPREDGVEDTESVVDEIRAAFGAFRPKAGSRHLDLQIPYRKVKMRCRSIPDELYDELVASDDDDAGLDFLAASCECILIPDGDIWRPALTAEGVFVKFDGSLADAMGWSVNSSREEILRAFGEVPMPRLAISEIVGTLRAWLSGRLMQREEEALGES